MDPKQDNVLMHYGTPRHSGRYPWGSGDNPYQHSGDFLSRVDELRKQGFTFTDKDGKTWSGDSAIAKSMGLTTTQFRTQLGLAKDERRSDDVAKVKRLREEGKTLKEIADEMGFQNDSSVRSLLNESSEARMNQARQTADFLKQQIAEKGMIDVGTGVERELGISREKLNQALYMLELEGYPVYGGGVPQVTNQGQQTNLKVLCPPETEHKDIYNFGDIHSVKDYVSYDDGETFKPGFVYPESMDSSRLKIDMPRTAAFSGMELWSFGVAWLIWTSENPTTPRCASLWMGRSTSKAWHSTATTKTSLTESMSSSTPTRRKGRRLAMCSRPSRITPTIPSAPSSRSMAVRAITSTRMESRSCLSSTNVPRKGTGGSGVIISPPNFFLSRV